MLHRGWGVHAIHDLITVHCERHHNYKLINTIQYISTSMKKPIHTDLNTCMHTYVHMMVCWYEPFRVLSVSLASRNVLSAFATAFRAMCLATSASASSSSAVCCLLTSAISS